MFADHADGFAVSPQALRRQTARRAPGYVAWTRRVVDRLLELL